MRTEESDHWPSTTRPAIASHVIHVALRGGGVEDVSSSACGATLLVAKLHEDGAIVITTDRGQEVGRYERGRWIGAYSHDWCKGIRMDWRKPVEKPEEWRRGVRKPLADGVLPTPIPASPREDDLKALGAGARDVTVLSPDGAIHRHAAIRFADVDGRALWLFDECGDVSVVYAPGNWSEVTPAVARASTERFDPVVVTLASGREVAYADVEGIDVNDVSGSLWLTAEDGEVIALLAPGAWSRLTVSG